VLKRLQRVRPGDLQGIVRASAALVKIAIGLRRKPFLSLLNQLRLRDAVAQAPDVQIEQKCRWVRWAHRVVPLEPNCLLDSLAAAALLRQDGFVVQLSIGVRYRQGGFEAHAWLGEDPQGSPEEFRVLYRIAQEPALAPASPGAGRGR